MCGLLSTSATLLKFLKDCTSQYNFRFIFLSSNGNIIKYDVSDDDDVKNDLSDDDIDDYGDIVDDDDDCDKVYLSIPLLFYLSMITMFSIYHHIYIEGEEIVENIITCRNFPDTLRLLFLLMIKIAIRATTTATATTLTATIDKTNNNKVDR